MRPAFRSKNEVVVDTLREWIVRGNLKPGSRLVIDDLAVEMGVSPIPIREALRQLEAEGFVTLQPYVGATVTAISLSLVSEIFALLEAMEIYCGRIACQRMGEDDLERLANLIYPMDANVDNPDQWSQDNKALHQFICDRAGTTLVKQVMQKILAHWDRLRLHYLQDVFARRIKIAQDEHKRILEAFRTRNPDQVEQVIREHNRSALAAYTRYVDAQLQPAAISRGRHKRTP